MDDHELACDVLRRAAVGADVDAGDLDRALEHVSSCAECAGLFEVDAIEAFVGCGEEDLTMPDVPIDPAALFERALATGLADPDPVARRRVAERLGSSRRLGPATLAALVTAAADDSDESVRVAALHSLDLLDAKVSFPQRVVDAWAAQPSEAADYLEDVLARLSAPSATVGGVAELTGTSGAGVDVALTGREGARGRIARDGDDVWLSVNGLPQGFENTAPVVAVTSALRDDPPSLLWAGEAPGLVAAAKPVSQGELRVLLGRMATKSESAPAELFGRVYLLGQRERAR